MKYIEYLRISNDVEFNKLASRIDIALIFNELQMDKYTSEITIKKIEELEGLLDELEKLKVKALISNNNSVLDMCEVYMIDIMYQKHALKIKIKN